MHIELFSFAAGVLLTLAAIIVFERLFGKLFGNRKLRNLEMEVKRQQKIIRKKDDLIKKSLQNMQKEAVNDKEGN